MSFTLADGEAIAILGPNGSGKTTLLKLVSGVLRPRAGHVRLDGSDVAALGRSRLACRIATVPQETHLAFDYTVLEIALMGRYPHLRTFELEGPAELDVARAALRSTGTAHLESRPFTTLSGGEKQRVVIASALAQLQDRTGTKRSRILLLDEPTASLDIRYQLEVAAILRALNADEGITIVLCTHDLAFAASVCRRLILIRSGEMLADGPTANVMTPDLVRRLYDVEADIVFHERAGHMTIVPLGVSRE